MSRLATVLVFFFTLLSAGPASGQVAPSPAPVASPVSMSVSGGLSAASRGNGVAAGMQLTFDLTDRLVFEAEGAHVGRGAGAGGMSGTVALLVNLLPGGGKTVPYVALGGGLYRASFNLDNERFFGRLSGQYPGGTQMIPIGGMGGFGMMQGPYNGPSMWAGPWTGNTFSPNHMPAFYVDRMGQMTVPRNGHWGMRSFVDPAVSIGAGVRLQLSPRFSVRPDARALVVIANGTSHTVGVITVGFGYRF
ncbi:MAG: hypothetical protein O2917_00510 [Acidobacteria bacterium]|nr:hypothetical protein [Acidobacteriota bacterium]